MVTFDDLPNELRKIILSIAHQSHPCAKMINELEFERDSDGLADGINQQRKTFMHKSSAHPSATSMYDSADW